MLVLHAAGSGLSHALLSQACAYDKAKVAQLVQCGTCIETLEAICRVYAERPAFGFCPPGEADWRTLTYQQFWLRVQAFAAGEHMHAPALATAYPPSPVVMPGCHWLVLAAAIWKGPHQCGINLPCLLHNHIL